MSKLFRNICLVFILITLIGNVNAQLSPGELTTAHAKLEGLKNCTKCHVLGEKETTSKCLDCHKEIGNLITQKSGYHASAEVTGKKCAECHGEHFGLDFEIIRFNKKKFNHNLTGYKLEGKHNEIECVDCHKTELIKNKISQRKGDTFLGLGTKCLSCHDDYHQNTISSQCTDCHNQNVFKPAIKFDHAKTKFQLIGKHQELSCEKCHKIEMQNGKKFQTFSGVAFANCTSCHEDVHNNKFGGECRKCHNEFSFQQVKNLKGFDHNKTDFPLQGMHRNVDCKGCHKGSVTRAVKHKKCTDCHRDYHQKQFVKNGITLDCSECHTVEKFTPSFYPIEKHNQSEFPLEGAHLATPCFSCHKTTNKWNFDSVGKRCVDCHKNIHNNYLDEKFMPEMDCEGCHSNKSWDDIMFDHNKTNFKLLGKHTYASCRECHFIEKKQGGIIQQFKGLASRCENCHADVHFKQFLEGYENECESCHGFNNWNAEKFNHNNSRFKLDGEHVGLDCVKCHKPNDNLIQKSIIYKFKDISCESCHL